MEGRSADRLRHAGIALAVAATLVLGPVAAGFLGAGDPPANAAVVDVSNSPNDR